MAGLGESAGGKHFALGHRRKEFLLQLLAAEAQHALGGKARQDHGTADARIPGAELFGDQDVFHHAQPLARIRLRIVHADETQLGGFLPDLAREFVFPVEFEGKLLVEFAFGKLPGRFLDIFLRFFEFKIHCFPPPG